MDVLWLIVAFIAWCVIVPVIIYCGATALGNAVRAVQNFFDDDR